MKIKFYLLLCCLIILFSIFLHNRLDKFFQVSDNRFYDSIQTLIYTMKTEGFKLDSQDLIGEEGRGLKESIFFIEVDDDFYNIIDDKFPEIYGLTGKRRASFAEAVDYIGAHNASEIIFDFTMEYGTTEKADKIISSSIKRASDNDVDIIVASKIDYNIDFLTHELKPVYRKPFEIFTPYYTGLINQKITEGYSVREPLLYTETGGVKYESLGFKAFLLNNGIENYHIENNLLKAGEHEIPVIIEGVEEEGFVNVYCNIIFSNRYTDFTIFPLRAFIDDEMFEEYTQEDRNYFLTAEGRSVFKDGIIFFGSAAAEDQDFVNYPLSFIAAEGNVPGVHMHASLLYALEQKEYYRVLEKSENYALLLAVLIILFIIYYYFGPVASFILLIIFICLYTGIISMVFGLNKTAFNLTHPIISMIFSFVGIQTGKYFFETKEKKFIKGAFSKYISPKLVTEMTKSPELLKLGGEEKDLTIFFSDIAGFTSISEGMSAPELVSLLNKYLTEMTEITMKHKGTVDKYIGDAVMSFWGAPVSDENQTYHACLASLEMIHKLKILNEDWKNQGYPEIQIRIGLNAGKAVVGNMGSENRFNYTVMGDSVNLAARLEGLNKEYGSKIMVTETIYKKNKNKFNFRELDFVKVKGKNEPIRVYQLIEFELDKLYNKGLDVYYKALEKYRKGNFKKALQLFIEADKIFNGDYCCNTFVKRCKFFIDNPPENWEGIWTMETK
ncbi:MAG: adenylate/guanylate cyclase domain-containing protein [Candidatus Muiribacteriota bacterium]